MLFNSLQFFLFFAVVLSGYAILPHRWQNRLLLLASYIFYGAWDWRFLSLIALSTVIDYLCGLKIAESSGAGRRRVYLLVSVVANLSILGFFKYFNFFSENLQGLLNAAGLQGWDARLHIVLPVGISFYTFQTMSYTLDIYYGKIRPTRKFFDFALFVAFFPQLVAGPIERAKTLFPQVLHPRQLSWEKFSEGSYLIFWGLFQKVFVADNLARFVDPVFAQHAPYLGAEVLVAVYAFSFQIFCDFAGYSNIARGVGKCLGFDIMVNFNLPYVSRTPQEFWRRWHISLSTWLRDYLYIPLGGNRQGMGRTARNIMITMLLGGLWHGAAWTFVLWGGYHGILIILGHLLEPVPDQGGWPSSTWGRRVKAVFQVVGMYHLVGLGWLIFRAQSLAQCGQMVYGVLFSWPAYSWQTFWDPFLRMAFFILPLVFVQWIQHAKNDLLIFYRLSLFPKALFYYTCFLLLIIFGVTGAKEFIYFQF